MKLNSTGRAIAHNLMETVKGTLTGPSHRAQVSDLTLQLDNIKLKELDIMIEANKGTITERNKELHVIESQEKVDALHEEIANTHICLVNELCNGLSVLVESINELKELVESCDSSLLLSVEYESESTYTLTEALIDIVSNKLPEMMESAISKDTELDINFQELFEGFNRSENKTFTELKDSELKENISSLIEASTVLVTKGEDIVNTTVDTYPEYCIGNADDKLIEMVTLMESFLVPITESLLSEYTNICTKVYKKNESGEE